MSDKHVESEPFVSEQEIVQQGAEVEVQQCRHIKINGVRCGSPALRGQEFCYFHRNWRADAHSNRQAQIADGAARNSAEAVSNNLPDDLPLLEDANAIQCAIFNTLRELRAGRLDHRTAALMLYGLQTASANLRHVQLEPAWEDVTVQQQPLLSAEEYEEEHGLADDEDENAVRPIDSFAEMNRDLIRMGANPAALDRVARRRR